MRNVVLFPGMVLPLTVGRERSRAAAQEAARLQRPLGVLLQNKPDVDEPGPDDMHWVGTTANVLRYVTAPDGSHHAICQGVKRFRVLQFLDGYPIHGRARASSSSSRPTVDAEIEGRAHTPETARDRDPAAAAAGARGNGRRACKASRARRGSPISSRA